MHTEGDINCEASALFIWLINGTVILLQIKSILELFVMAAKNFNHNQPHLENFETSGEDQIAQLR